MDKSEIRFIHLHLDGRSGGTTIAYKRFFDSVVFSIAICNDNDLYVKKIGREISYKRLEEAFTKNNYNTNCYAIEGGNIITKNMIFDVLDLSATFADSTLKSMTLFDLKHVAISKAIVLLLESAIN